MILSRTIKKEDMTTSRWSGGTTTEIFIWPEGARYADRDFLFRISTAAVELESSDFTSLPDYDRLIASLEGVMELTHAEEHGARKALVRPLGDVHFFDGGVPTHCEGRARDLNLMLRKGRCTGSLAFIEEGGELEPRIAPGELMLAYDTAAGSAAVFRTDGAPGGEAEAFTFRAAGKTAFFTVRMQGGER